MTAGVLTNNGWWLLIYSFVLSQHPAPPTVPPPHQHRWREPCNNFACFHDNHLLLSPHLSTSSSHPSLSPHSHLSLFSLHTVGISRSKRVIARWTDRYRDLAESEKSRQRRTRGQKSPRPCYCYCSHLSPQTVAMFKPSDGHAVFPLT